MVVPDSLTHLCGTRFRFALLILVLLCLSTTWANILSFNLATICINNNQLLNSSDHVGPINSGEQTIAIASMAAGAVVGTFPVIMLVNQYGSRSVFGVLGILTAMVTLFTPLAIQVGFEWLCLCRVLQGVAFAANYPVIGAFTATWTYYKQTGLFVSILACYIQLAPIFSNAIGGALCDYSGWASIYYLHGSITLFLFTLYYLAFRNNPNKHPFVGIIEKEKIGRGKTTGKTTKADVPLLAILKTPAIWGIWIGAVGNFVISDVFFVFTPVYLSEALHFSTSNSGFSAMYPPIAQVITKIVTGFVSDKIKIISDTWKFRIFNSISFFGSAAIVVALAFMEDHHVNVNSPVIALALAVLGANTGGFYKAGPYISKQYSHIVTGIMSQCNCVVLLILPFIVHAVAPDNTIQQWKTVFLVVAVIVVIQNELIPLYRLFNLARKQHRVHSDPSLVGSFVGQGFRPGRQIVDPNSDLSSMQEICPELVKLHVLIEPTTLTEFMTTDAFEVTVHQLGGWLEIESAGYCVSSKACGATKLMEKVLMRPGFKPDDMVFSTNPEEMTNLNQQASYKGSRSPVCWLF